MKKHLYQPSGPSLMPADECFSSNRRSKRKPPKFKEVVEIIHELRVQQMYMKDVAKKHHMSF